MKKMGIMISTLAGLCLLAGSARAHGYDSYNDSPRTQRVRVIERVQPQRVQFRERFTAPRQRIVERVAPVRCAEPMRVIEPVRCAAPVQVMQPVRYAEPVRVIAPVMVHVALPGLHLSFGL